MANKPLEQTKRELALIPRGDFAQNTFRRNFYAMRMNSLGSDPEFPPDLPSVFEQATKSVRANWPDFEPQYDPRLLDK
jgi:hypothetical protein